LIAVELTKGFFYKIPLEPTNPESVTNENGPRGDLPS